ncbi:MAG: hypothetical protein IJX97_00955, partial [Clostridia bacterium]|nr:hypothetical protein [Clostridia bacterium]
MNNFKKLQKKLLAAASFLTASLATAIPAFAENTEVEPHGWHDPMLYVFVAFVAGFFTLFIGSIVLYFWIKRKKKEKEWKESEGTIKLYEDLDDAKWDAPDSVFLDALEPTAALLLDDQPVEKIHGLDGIIITEHNPDPVQAINSGADPYAYRINDDLKNYVYQDVANVTIEDNRLVVEASPKPINTAKTPETEPITYLTVSDDMNDQKHGYVSTGKGVYEDSVTRSVLEDEPPVAPEEPKITPAVTPKSEPATYIAKEVPITIVTSKEDDGVVEIKASIYENVVAPVTLVDEPKAPEMPEPVIAASVPMTDPIALNFVREEEPVVIPVSEASIYESAESAVMLEDEIIPIPAEPVVIPETVIPGVSPIDASIVAEELPVVIPVTEAEIYEDNVARTVLEDEIVPAAPTEPVKIAEAATPAQSFVDSFVVAEEEPVIIPAAEAAVYEDSVARTVLEDEIVPAAPAEPVKIAEAATPAQSFVDSFVVAEEEPVIIPAAEAAVYEDNVARTVLEDEIVPAAPAEPVKIAEAATPAQSFVDSFVVAEEEPVIIPAAEA